MAVVVVVVGREEVRVVGVVVGRRREVGETVGSFAPVGRARCKHCQPIMNLRVSVVR